MPKVFSYVLGRNASLQTIEETSAASEVVEEILVEQLPKTNTNILDDIIAE